MVSPHLVPIIIAGPTASGKSALALKLAKKHGGEIICADSRQFYQFMQIGTASPSEHEKALVPHHGFNNIDPREDKIDAGFFIDFALKKIFECQNRGKRPIVVGGTGLYLRSLRYGLSDVPRSDPIVMKDLVKECEASGLLAMYEALKNLDSNSAEKISPSDQYRILRAHEIWRITGRKPSELRQSFSKQDAIIKAHWIIKKCSIGDLDSALKNRIQNMKDQGLVEEACALRNKLVKNHWALEVMGYAEALSYADGLISKQDFIERSFFRHRQYAKRQICWFSKEKFYTWHLS